MADFVFQIRLERPATSEATIGDIVNVYDAAEIVEPPAGYLGFIKVTGFPDSASITKESLAAIVASYYMQDETLPEPGETGVDTSERMKIPVEDRDKFPESQWSNIRKVNVDLNNLPEPYKSELLTSKETTIPLSDINGKFFHRKLKRNLIQSDLNG